MSEQNCSATVVSADLPCCSHEPFKRSEAPREADPYRAVQAPDGAASPRRAGGPRPDQGLREFSSTPFQETGLQKFPKHLSPFCHSSSVQYSVSICVGSSVWPGIKMLASLVSGNAVSVVLLAGELPRPPVLVTVPVREATDREFWKGSDENWVLEINLVCQHTFDWKNSVSDLQ